MFLLPSVYCTHIYIYLYTEPHSSFILIYTSHCISLFHIHISIYPIRLATSSCSARSSSHSFSPHPPFYSPHRLPQHPSASVSTLSAASLPPKQLHTSSASQAFSTANAGPAASRIVGYRYVQRLPLLNADICTPALLIILFLPTRIAPRTHIRAHM